VWICSGAAIGAGVGLVLFKFVGMSRSDYVVFGAAILTLFGGFLGAFGALQQSRERAETTKRTLDSVTGGDSFVYLQPLRQTKGVKYFFRQAGTPPIFDVTVRVQEIVVLEGKQKHGR
jgi:hypothetical protein